MGVSIHARTRRATVGGPCGPEVVVVSIHARTRRATPLPATSRHNWVSFNPRPHAAGDAADLGDEGRMPGVSIHARTRRATRRLPGGEPGVAGFNPRPHAAGDWCGWPGRWRCGCFNPRPHAAGDSTAAAARHRRRTSFNPRPHAAGDIVRTVPDARAIDVSIHARTRRATGSRVHLEAYALVSIHARTRRATSGRPRPSIGSGFQSTPARGGRRGPSLRPPAGPGCFNPRPHAAGDMADAHRTSPVIPFQSTPARGGRRDPLGTPRMPPVFQSTPARGGRRGRP